MKHTELNENSDDDEFSSYSTSIVKRPITIVPGDNDIDLSVGDCTYQYNLSYDSNALHFNNNNLAVSSESDGISVFEKDGEGGLHAYGDGVWDPAEVFVDTNGNDEYDLGEDFTDGNQNGIWDEAEEFTDALNGVWDEGEPFIDALNGKYDEGIDQYYHILYIKSSALIEYTGEKFTDCDSSGLCKKNQEWNFDLGIIWDDNEPFEDINYNNVWDGPNGVYDRGELFEDRGNGKYDKGEEFTDSRNKIWDDAESFIDALNGVWDKGEGDWHEPFNDYGIDNISDKDLEKWKDSFSNSRV